MFSSIFFGLQSCLLLFLLLLTSVEPETQSLPTYFGDRAKMLGKNKKKQVAQARDRKRRLTRTAPEAERNVDKSADFCFPDSNGFFGTVGDRTHTIVRYGVGVETGASADLDGILRGVKRSVEHYVITNTFPTVCGLARVRRAVSGVNGFYFAPELEEEVGTRNAKCDVETDENECGVYSGEVAVYGSDVTDILPIVADSLEIANPRAAEIHDELVRVFYVELKSSEVKSKGGGGGDSGLSAAALASIILTILAVVVALLAYVMYRRKRANPMRPTGTMQPPAFIDVTPEDSDLASF